MVLLEKRDKTFERTERVAEREVRTIEQGIRLEKIKWETELHAVKSCTK